MDHTHTSQTEPTKHTKTHRTNFFLSNFSSFQHLAMYQLITEQKSRIS